MQKTDNIVSIMEKETELYEIGYILKPDLGEEAVLSFSEKLRNAVTDKDGLVISEGRAKKLELAYPIKKETAATFNWIRFTSKPHLLKDLKDYLEKQKDALRFIIIRTEKEKPLKPISVKKMEKAAKKQKEKKEEGTQIQEEEIDKKIEELLGN